MKIAVRVSETDALGHINNKHYFDYMEESRNELYKAIDLCLDENQTFILAEVSCKYIRQGYYGQTLDIITTITHIGNKSIILYTEMYDDDTRELIAKGESISVFFDIKAQKSSQIPEMYKKKLKNFTKGEIDNV